MSDKEKKTQDNPAPESKAKVTKVDTKAVAKEKNKKQLEKDKKKNGLNQWLKEMKVELAKVMWPSKKQTATYTTTVLCCVAIVGAFIWIFDFLASNVILALGSLI